MFLSFILISLSLQNFTFVTGIPVIIPDPENDVYRIHYEQTIILFGVTPAPNIGQVVNPPSNIDIKKGDYHDEVDIVRLKIDGQNLNLTFAGNINDWVSDADHETSAIIFLYPDFNMEIYKQGDQQYPRYVAFYQNQSEYGPDYKFVFINEINNETWWVWDGSGWTLSNGLSANIGSASGKSIIANVPSGAYTIPDNITYFAVAEHDNYLGGGEAIAYLDIAPNDYALWSVSETIPSYNIFIVVGLLFGLSMVIARKYIKGK